MLVAATVRCGIIPTFSRLQKSNDNRMNFSFKYMRYTLIWLCLVLLVGCAGTLAQSDAKSITVHLPVEKARSIVLDELIVWGVQVENYNPGSYHIEGFCRDRSIPITGGGGILTTRGSKVSIWLKPLGADTTEISVAGTTYGTIWRNSELADSILEDIRTVSKQRTESHIGINAVKSILAEAERGDAKSQNSLGVIYHDGEEVPKDYAEAAKWFHKSAEQGVAIAQNNLGVMYYKGEGVPKDYTEAVKWYRKAAEQGFPMAQNNLGWMYYKGDGVPLNYVEAYMWVSLAVDRGNKEAKSGLAELKQHMTSEQVTEAEKRAAAWQPTTR